jgi:hypothetical protein
LIFNMTNAMLTQDPAMRPMTMLPNVFAWFIMATRTCDVLMWELTPVWPSAAKCGCLWPRKWKRKFKYSKPLRGLQLSYSIIFCYNLFCPLWYWQVEHYIVNRHVLEHSSRRSGSVEIQNMKRSGSFNAMICFIECLVHVKNVLQTIHYTFSVPLSHSTKLLIKVRAHDAYKIIGRNVSKESVTVETTNKVVAFSQYKVRGSWICW